MLKLQKLKISALALLAGMSSGGAAPPVIGVPDQSAPFGALTRVNEGGYQVVTTGGLVISTASITGGNGANHWQISSGGVITPTSTGDSANLNGGPYSLTVQINTIYTATVTISIQASVYSVASITQMRDVVNLTSNPFGQVIRCRGGEYNAARADIRIQRTVAPTGTWDGTNHIVIEPHAGEVVNIYRLGISGSSFTAQYIRFKDLNLRGEAGLVGGIYDASACTHIWFDGITGYCPDVAPSLRPTLPKGLEIYRYASGSSFVKITNCFLEGFKDSYHITGNDCEITNCVSTRALADDFKINKPCSRLKFKWNVGHDKIEEYTDWPILGITRGPTQTVVFIDPAGAAGFTPGTHSLVIKGLTNGCEGLNNYSAGITYTVNAGLGTLTFNHNSSGYTDWISGGVARRAAAHSDMFQLNATGAVAGDLDDIEIIGNRFSSQHPTIARAEPGYTQAFLFTATSATAKVRRLKFQGNAVYIPSVHGITISYSEDGLYEWNTLVGMPDWPFFPSQGQTTALAIQGGSGNTVRYNAMTASTLVGVSTNEGNVQFAKTSGALIAAFGTFRALTQSFDFLTHMAMAAGGTLDSAITGNAYHAGAIGTGYVDFVARTTNFPSSGVAPAITTAPTISGTPTEGQTLTSALGTVTGSPTPTSTRQWQRGGVDIAGATGSSYGPLTADDVGYAITVRQVASNGVGSPATRDSAATTPVASGATLTALAAPVYSTQIPTDNNVTANPAKLSLSGTGTSHPLYIPALGTDWFTGIFFQAGDLPQRNGVCVLAMSGQTSNLSQGNDRGVIINEWGISPGTKGAVTVSIRSGGTHWWNPADGTTPQPLSTTQNVERGKDYLLVIGNISDRPFISLVDIAAETVKSNASRGAATSVAALDVFSHFGGGEPTSGYKSISGITTGATTTVTFTSTHGFGVGDMIYFSGTSGSTWINGTYARIASAPTTTSVTLQNLDMTPYQDTTGFAAWTSGGTGRTRGSDLGFSGHIGALFHIRGTIPNNGDGTSPIPTSTALLNLALGIKTPQQLVTDIGGTLRYYNAMDPDASYAADPAGTITTAASATGRALHRRGRPIRKASIRLQSMGDGFIWGVLPGQTAGRVYFEGTYNAASGTPIFEGRLVRIDTGAAVGGFDWQRIQGQTSGAGAFSGYLDEVPAGVGFRREVRVAQQPATSIAHYERHAVGLVVAVNAQSQMGVMFSNSAISGTGSYWGKVTPTSDDNLWASYLGVNNFNVEFTPAQHTSVRRLDPLTISVFGDGMLTLTEKLKDLTGMPVMVAAMHDGGKGPLMFYLDRQTGTQTLTITSATTAQVFSPDPDFAAPGYEPSVSPFVPASQHAVIKAGTFSIAVAGGGTITDNGSGVLSGSGPGWTATGTVDYRAVTNAISITFTGTGFAGAATLTYVYIAEYTAGTTTAKTTLDGFSLWGVDGEYGSGMVANAYYKMGQGRVTAVLMPWWTSMPGGSYTGPASDAQIYKAVSDEWKNIITRHKAVPNAANALFFPGPAGRDCPTGATGDDYASLATQNRTGGHRVMTQRFVASRPEDTRLAAHLYDATAAGNIANHQDVDGALMYGERLAVSLAAGFGIITDHRPKMTAVEFVSGSGKTQIDITFDLDGATALATVTGGAYAGTPLDCYGFDVGTHASSQDSAFGARTKTGFTSQIIAANKVRLTKTSGAWLAVTTVSYMSGPIWTGGNNAAADLANLNLTLQSNVNPGWYTLPASRTWRGSPAFPFMDQLVSGS